MGAAGSRWGWRLDAVTGSVLLVVAQAVDGGGTPRPRVVHLPGGVRLLRWAAPVLVALEAVQAVVHLLGPVREPDVISAALAGVLVVTSSAQAWIAWRCPPMTRVDGDGVLVRSRSLRAERFTWAEISWVHPAGPRTRSTSLHLRAGGRPVALPGVDHEAGTWLARVVEDVHAGVGSVARAEPG